MPARKAIAPIAVERVVAGSVDDPKTQYALDRLVDSVSSLQSVARGQTFVVDLVVGANTIAHALGREPRIVNVTPTVADATFAWALDRNAAHRNRQVTINVVGVDQPGALVEIR